MDWVFKEKWSWTNTKRKENVIKTKNFFVNKASLFIMLEFIGALFEAFGLVLLLEVVVIGRISKFCAGE